MRRPSILFTLVLGSVSACASSSRAEQWPEVQEIHESHHFTDVDQAGFNTTIRNKAGDAVYELSCHSGVFEGDGKFDYSGLVACRLSSLYSRETVSTLLTETPRQATDWTNRGRFLAQHLRPGCAEYPEWGGTRSFRLRGMELVISIVDPKFGSSAAIDAYTIEVTVRKDANAQTPLAQAPKAPEPPWFYRDAACAEK